MPTITLLLIFSVFLFNSLFLSNFYVLSFTPFLASFSLYSLLFPFVAVVLLLLHYAQLRPLLYCLPWQVFTILPLNHFCPGIGVLPKPPIGLSAAQPSPLTCASRATSHSQIKESHFVFFAHHGIPIRIRVGILSYYLSWHASSDSNLSFPLLGGMSSQQDISPKKVWAGTPE